jgi:hypothetical protein
MLTTHRNVSQRRALMVVAFAATSTLAAGVADAHFRLVMPANVVAQDALGSPQKTGPCGNEAPQTPSNVVTQFRPGDTVTIQIDETIYHPGHYRVALECPSFSALPPDPVVSTGSSQCGSAAIQQNPAFPVLADGVLQHAQPFRAPQSIEVTLPANVTGSSCTLQVLEFMSDHAAPCFYYHCAKIAILNVPADAGASTDAARDAAGGSGGAAGAGTTDGGPGTGGFAGAGATGTGATGGTSGSAGTTSSGGSAGAGGASGGSGSGATAGAGGGGNAGHGGASGSPIETTGCTCSAAGANPRSIGASAFLALSLVVVRRHQRRRR